VQKKERKKSKREREREIVNYRALIIFDGTNYFDESGWKSFLPISQKKFFRYYSFLLLNLPAAAAAWHVYVNANRAERIKETATTNA